VQLALRSRLAAVAITMAAAAVVCAPADAFFTSGGIGTSAEASAGFTAAVVSVPATAVNTVTVTWTSQASISAAANGAVTYTVQRKLGAGAYADVATGGCAGALAYNTTSCADTIAAAGSYTYRVVANRSTWTAISADTSAVAVTVDTTPPTVSSINRVATSPTNATSVAWTVTFSESVSGVDATDFSLVRSGVTGGTLVVAGSGATRTVTASGYGGSGTLGLNLVDDDTILDTAANKLGGTGAANGNFTGQVYSVDVVAPTATVTRSASTPTLAASVTWLVTFNETVTGVDSADFALVKSGLATAAITGVTGSGATRTVTASTSTGSGTLGLNVVPNGTIKDSVNNTLVAASTGEVYTVDRTGPVLTALDMLDVNQNGKVDRVTATFDETLASSTDIAAWSLSSMPSAGTLASVSTSGNVATLTITEGSGAADTSVGSFTVALSATVTGIRDSLNNQGSFTNTAPSDGASPVLISAGDQDTSGIDGRLETNDSMRIQFSELITGGVPTSVTITESRPASGNVTLNISGLTNGALNMASTNYLSAASTTVAFSGTTLASSPNLIVVQVGSCTSGAIACGKVATGTGTMTYTAAPTLTDAAGNGAVGSVTYQTHVF
jgi:hypothetical protein